WEKMNGHNDKSGYRMRQYNDKVGFYTELIKQYGKNNEWVLGATAEGWHALHERRESTWSGDKAQNRDSLAFYLLAQRRFSPDWSARLALGTFYNRFDNMWGLRVILEARYKEMIMFGPSFAWYPFGISDAYAGCSASDLMTATAFFRLELGNPIREFYQKSQMERVKKVDMEELGLAPEK
ncbi:MAG: hypothetical protein NTZ97_05090, partial [Candidatus Moranbacteria bacterium]|nr:hypothetical protein [Candidatus Moranbacteria bacterium]